MLVLALETATEQVGVALGSHDGLLGSIQIARGKRHAETLTPAIEFLMRQCDRMLTELSAVAVDVGPGLFTGMRVGISAAKAIGYALDIPVVPVVSLDALAMPVRHDAETVTAVIDGRRGEVFSATYRNFVTGGERLSDPTTGSIDDLIADVMDRGQPTIFVGDGAEKFRAQIESAMPAAFAAADLASPTAVSVLALAVPMVLRDETQSAAAVEALYLRAPDAQINWQTRNGAVGG